MLQVKPVQCTSNLKSLYTVNPKRKIQVKPVQYVHNLESSYTVNHKRKLQVKPVQYVHVIKGKNHFQSFKLSRLNIYNGIPWDVICNTGY